jgi:hypothetical protein
LAFFRVFGYLIEEFFVAGVYVADVPGVGRLTLEEFDDGAKVREGTNRLQGRKTWFSAVAPEAGEADCVGQVCECNASLVEGSGDSPVRLLGSLRGIGCFEVEADDMVQVVLSVQERRFLRTRF